MRGRGTPPCRGRRLPALLPAVLAGIAGTAAIAAASSAAAQVIGPAGDGRGSIQPLADPLLRPAARLVGLQAGLPPEVQAAWERFRAGAGGEWRGYADPGSGRIAGAEGKGIPWVPGKGNRLRAADLAAHLHGGKEVDLAVLESVARAFLPRVAELLGLPGPGLGAAEGALVLDRGRSGRFGDYLWYVDFRLVQGGLPVEGARVSFRVNHGNLVQFGSENLPAPGTPVPPVRVTREEALATLEIHAGGFAKGDVLLDPGSLRLLPVAGEEGAGRGLAAVWQITFRRPGGTETWRGRVDAGTGEVRDLMDVNAYARATGGVYPRSFTDGGAELPLPHVDLSTGGFADSAGSFDFSGASTRSTLNGRYVSVADACGALSLSTEPDGSLAFGTSPGADCATPGAGGAGNTNASRTAYYAASRGKEVGRGWLPANPWLAGQLRANVNFRQTCNAFWNGTINFFHSGDGCGNTGEIADIVLHEYGHGLDGNDGGGFSPDLGTGEAYADIVAVLFTHQSCIGPGLRPGNCGGYGDPCVSCTGARDIDWGRRALGVPHTVANFVQTSCPGSSFYVGPCGREAHCESYVASEALWDFASRDLPGAGGAAAWAVAERLWYLSVPTAGAAFACDASGPAWTADGCGMGSLWRVLRAADDDDGNLANGTPHSCHLFAAFDRHGIACPTDPGARTCFAACAPPPAPELQVTAGELRVDLSWTSAGPGAVYDVFKSELGCAAGFVKVAEDLAATAFADREAAAGFEYAYRVVAHPAGSAACAAPPSACAGAIPRARPCTAPATPTGLAATAVGLGGVDLAWNAVAGATHYALLRAPAAGGALTPAGTAAAPYFADRGLPDGTAYRYVVRAYQRECGSSDSGEASARTVGCPAAALYADGFESREGLAGWTVGTLAGHFGEGDWRGVQVCPAASGSRIFRFGGPGCAEPYAERQHTFARPAGDGGLAVPPGALRTRLAWRHRWSFEEGYDGAYLRLAMDGGTPVAVPASALVTGPKYNETAYTGTAVFTGERADFAASMADLDAVCDALGGGGGGCGGHRIDVEFVAVSDASAGGAGWFLDDVLVSACRPDCRAPAAPAAVAAAPALDRGIRVTWSTPPGEARSFRVERARGTCDAPGAFSTVAGNLAGAVFVDLAAEPGVSYAYRVTAMDSTGLCASPRSACSGATANPPAAPAGFYTLPPCRLLDTRRPSEGPALGAEEERTLTLAGRCGVPAGARALSVNLTVVEPAAAGHLVLAPADQPLPATSAINFQKGKTRANNAVLALAGDGSGTVEVRAGTLGSVHLIVDVNGYFQ